MQATDGVIRRVAELGTGMQFGQHDLHADRPVFGSLSTGMPRPLSATSTEPSVCRVTTMSLQKPAKASSTELSMIPTGSA